jgi:hypothetical protein
LQKEVWYLWAYCITWGEPPTPRSWKPYGNGWPQRISMKLESSWAYAHNTDSLFPVSQTLQNPWPNVQRKMKPPNCGLQKWRPPSKH